MNRTVLTIVTLAGIAAGYHAVLGRSHLAEIRALQARFGDAYTRFEAADLEATRTSQLHACAEELDRCRAEAAARVAAPVGSPPLLATTGALKGAGLVVERAEALPADTQLALPHDRVRVVVAGTFADLYRGVAKLENGAPPARVTEIAIRRAPDSGVLRCDLTVVRAWRPSR